MLNKADIDGLDLFLRRKGNSQMRHSRMKSEGVFPAGTMLDKWRVECLVGSGGNGEVYRVVDTESGSEAAVKALIRDDAESRIRFEREVAFLVRNELPQFPRYFGKGEFDGYSYFILELLEPLDIPKEENGIAEYLIGICACVRALHFSGIVHCDLKPRNVMKRASGEMVLIDFGLAKETREFLLRSGDGPSMSGKAVASGTLGYASPEQMTGGDVTFAADIHAIGCIANAAFDGNPPPNWAAIIRRATSSIPEQRYATVDELANAIEKRNLPRNIMRTGLAAAAVAIAAVVSAVCDKLPIVRDIAEEMRFAKLCEEIGPQKTLLQLRHGTNVFSRPLRLKSNHEYLVAGPGIFDAAIVSDNTNTVVRLKNCVFLNRSSVPLSDAGIRYAFQGGAYLNFTNMERPEGFATIRFEDFDGAFNDVRFKGPETISGLNKLREREISGMLQKETSQTGREDYDF